MVEQNNGQQEHPKPDRHNAKRLTYAKRWAVIYALANNESICSITRDLHVSRHNVLAILKTNTQEIEAAQRCIKYLIEGHYIDLQIRAMDKIERRIEGARSFRELLNIYDWMTDKVKAFDEPVKTQNPYPLSIKLAALRRAKRNGLSLPSA